jgi:hypothetical protein
MSVILLTALVLLVGAVTYRLFDRLVRPVRVGAVCFLMVSLVAFILQIRTHQGKTSDLPVSSDEHASNVPNPNDDPGSAAYLTFQRTSQEDQDFLNEILRHQDQQGKRSSTKVQTVDKAGIIGSGDGAVLKGELVANSGGVKRSEPVAHKETVKRAQLVTHSEVLKRAQLVQSREPMIEPR